MKHKICILILMGLQTGCAVELRDRERQPDEKPVTELQVENEYTLPIPLVQSEQTVLHYDRLVISRNAQFITQGLNVKIEIDELISEGGTIRTFKADQTAVLGANGRGGGNLELIIGKAHGNLQIVMQGEAGGTGIDGAAPDESLRGPKGAPGKSATFDPIDTSRITGVARNGFPGGQGLAGYPGGNGFKGGDSGKASIKVAEAEDFQLIYIKRPGRGGLGGVGGAGGPGGFGGEPGKETAPAYNGPPAHKYTVAGPQGPQGPQGPAGQSGINGYEEKICIQKGSEEHHCE